MVQLTGTPQSIRHIFHQREYVIPTYQRRYSWGNAHCQDLISDLASFYNEKNEDDRYFMGCIVIARQGAKGPWEVVDGQQRLTTLSLLAKALFMKDTDNRALESILKKEDKNTRKITDELRLVSEVWAGDKENFQDVLLADDIKPVSKKRLLENRFLANFLCIQQALMDEKIPLSGHELQNFMSVLLDDVDLLPIECESRERALQIFQKLNDRGMLLTDADMFKAELYRQTPVGGEQNQFVKDWNGLSEKFIVAGGARKAVKDDFVQDLFRIDMHVLRASVNDVSKEKALRSYFLSTQKQRLGNPDKVMARLQKYRAIFYEWPKAARIQVWWSILSTNPNEYWRYPLFVFLDKHGLCDKSGLFSLPEEKTKEFVALLENTARYFFIKGVATNSVNSIKDTVFKVCAAIAKDENYAELYRKNAEGNLGDFLKRLGAGEYGRYQKSLVLTNSALYVLQEGADIKGYATLLLNGEYHIEHILPQQWNDYDGWNDQTHERDIDKLGNLIPFEQRLNIRASNEFFSRKRKEYKKSSLAEVKGLRDTQKWTPETLAERHEKVLNRLREFFQSGFEN